MNRQQAAALVMYLQRAHGIIPTTGAEWTQIAAILPVIEAVANGHITIEASPTPAPEPAQD